MRKDQKAWIRYLEQQRKKISIDIDIISEKDTVEESWGYIGASIKIINMVNSILPKKKLSEIGRYELGIDISEKLIGRYLLKIKFGGIERYTPQNRGYDFITKGGYKVNIKSGILRYGSWTFIKKYYDYLADYFLCIGYDNKYSENVKILHVWLIGKDRIKELETKNIIIRNEEKYLLEFQIYEYFL